MIDYKKTITNIHKLLPELDSDTLFKIMEAIVEEITPAYNWPSGIRTPIFGQILVAGPNEITCECNNQK